MDRKSLIFYIIVPLLAALVGSGFGAWAVYRFQVIQERKISYTENYSEWLNLNNIITSRIHGLCEFANFYLDPNSGRITNNYRLSVFNGILSNNKLSFEGLTRHDPQSEDINLLTKIIHHEARYAKLLDMIAIRNDFITKKYIVENPSSISLITESWFGSNDLSHIDSLNMLISGLTIYLWAEMIEISERINDLTRERFRRDLSLSLEMNRYGKTTRFESNEMRDILSILRKVRQSGVIAENQ